MTFTLAAGRPQRQVICATWLCLTVFFNSHWIISYTAAWILDYFLLQCHITAPVELFTLGCLRWERFGKRLLMRSYGVTWCFWLWMWVEILSCGSRVSDCAGLRSSKKTSICTGKNFQKEKKIPIVKCQCHFIQAFPFLTQSTSNVACKVKGLRVKYEVIIFKPEQSKVYKEDFWKKQGKLAFTTNNRLLWSNAFWPGLTKCLFK